ncbi:mediator of RNA polymerase II transcription subunit 18-like isoform X2 [Patiria miniata]|uniref:Mediator of RNA polymerase II transcription subunit 18 n=1 Tax=Patiria miniata TaxID=46514 RepID=A0A913ZIR2_PATMI|nr:mediator of RNA polymerase II transcription subunit 18-like [Patiria miniata]XP_038075205.1 mediator of RNA polymerase II transcription subunit 18-like isoform X2 [Patiria miniata]
MTSSLPGVNLSNLASSSVPSLQEFVLQGSVVDSACDALLHRLRALCDNVDRAPETFQDHEMVYLLRTSGPGNPVVLRARHARDQHNMPWQLRYLGQSDISDKSRLVTVRSYLDCSTSEQLPQFLTDIGFRLDHEFVAKGHMFRKGKMKVTITKIFKILTPGNLEALEPLSISQLVELSIIAPSGTDGIGEDMRAFAEQLRPLVSMEKI